VFRRGGLLAQIALAWVLRNPVVSAPIVVATKPHHLADGAAAVEVTLTLVEADLLEQHYARACPWGIDRSQPFRRRRMDSWCGFQLSV
jgi:aryl-alcohol dehydrogenase-like predicted oxidoreductase